MKMLQRLLFFPLLFLLFLSQFTSGQKGVPGDFCLSDHEYRLVDLINAHRVVNGLIVIPLSASLSYVARTHVTDLYNNHPDTSICNLNSWSDKGFWTACCHNKYFPQEECIRKKPGELTNYIGEGYELTYAELYDTHPDTVFRFWKGIDEANAFLLNEGVWKKNNWNAMGVGIFKNYAVLWMGEKSDPSAIPEPCTAVKANNEKEMQENVAAGDVTLITSITGRYYIVVASFPTLADARKEVKRYKDMKDGNISILKNNQGQFRISINDYPSLDEAKQGKGKYSESFKDAWILNF